MKYFLTLLLTTVSVLLFLTTRDHAALRVLVHQYQDSLTTFHHVVRVHRAQDSSCLTCKAIKEYQLNNCNHAK